MTLSEPPKRRTVEEIQRDLKRLRELGRPEDYATTSARLIHELQRTQRRRYART